jgi:response regulator RpfG family c-di-GMP phosphodiesterase
MSEDRVTEDSPRTLLLVDDEERILTALHRTLRREGYALLTASTPQRAIRLLEEERVDLILTDHKMPGMSGLELLEHASRLQPSAARLLITGWAQAVTRDEIESLGICAIVPKPWKDSELKDALHKALG